jgi:hypothetical protein
MVVTNRKQRKALRAEGWTLEDSWGDNEVWCDGAVAVRVFEDGSIYVHSYVDRSRLAEFLSIVDRNTK